MINNQKRLQLIRQKDNPEKYKIYESERSKLPRERERRKKYFKKLNATSKRKEYKREWNKNWRSVPENREKYNEYMREWRKDKNASNRSNVQHNQVSYKEETK